MPLRYGSIRYVNNLPVDHALIEGKVPHDAGTIDTTTGVPATLNRAMAERELDVSAVSAASLAPGGTLSKVPIQILPEATIASHGPVESVLLVSRVPFDHLDGKDIHVTDASATGALLLRILLERDLGIRPNYTTQGIHGLDFLAGTDDSAAVLIIGDQALRMQARIENGDEGTQGLHVLDLGEAWRAYTGLPMVYALWVANPAYSDKHGEQLDAFRKALTASITCGAENADELVTLAAERTGMDPARIRTYYGRLRYALGEPERLGLQRFLQEASALTGKPERKHMSILEATA